MPEHLGKSFEVETRPPALTAEAAHALIANLGEKKDMRRTARFVGMTLGALVDVSELLEKHADHMSDKAYNEMRWCIEAFMQDVGA